MNAATRQTVVLIVDDDPGDVLLIEEALRLLPDHPAVYVAGDGQEAVAFLRRSGPFTAVPRPDMVLLDLNMPRMNGLQVLAEVKADRWLSSIPIIVFTTSQDPGDILDSYDAHANAYVTKPLNLDDLTDAVHQIDHFFARIAALPPELPAAH